MNDKIIKVTDPTSYSETLSEIYEDFDYAYNKVNELYNDLKSGKISLLSKEDKEYNILYNTANYHTL